MVVFSLTLVRHGETRFNRENIIQGQTDIPLSETGRQQARLIALRLQHEKFTHVFASDLQRALQTAQIILDANKLCQCRLVTDAQLRERKFGDFEGKKFMELATAAQRHSVAMANFTPRGAEPVSQVRQRAKSFFHQLCLELLTFRTDAESSPLSGKRRLGSQDDCPTPDRQLAPSSPSPDSASPHRDISPHPSIPCPSPPTLVGCSKRARHGDPTSNVFSFEDGDDENETVIGRSDSSSSSGCSSLPESAESGDTDVLTPNGNTPPTNFSLDLDSEGHEADPCEEVTLAPALGDAELEEVDVFSSFSPVTERVNVGFTTAEYVQGSLTLETTESEVAPTEKHEFSSSSSSSSPSSSLPEATKTNHAPAVFSAQWGSTPMVIPTDCQSQRTFISSQANSLPGSSLPLGAVTDAEIRNSVPRPQKAVHGCPNVSLSPLLEHRLSSMSSISSGRSGSLDEGDLGPALAADVLVVSHSGFLKELVRHFVDELQCKLPMGRNLALHCPNASISKFIVTVEENETPVVLCLLMHDKDHLLTMNVDEAKRMF